MGDGRYNKKFFVLHKHEEEEEEEGEESIVRFSCGALDFKSKLF